MLTDKDSICECFKSLIKIGAVGFFSMPAGELCMPTIMGTTLRYNNCPCCGAEVRGTEITKDTYLKIRHNLKRI